MPRSKRSGILGSCERVSAARIASAVVACERCPELRACCARVAAKKKRAHRADDYCGRPVPAFDDSSARVVLVGLAKCGSTARSSARVLQIKPSSVTAATDSSYVTR